MKKYFVHILCCLSILGMTGCMEEMEPEHIESSEPSEYILFSATMGTITKSVDVNTYSTGYLIAEESPWQDFEEAQTKADAMMQLSGEAALTMFAYNGDWREDVVSLDASTNAKYEFDGNVLEGKKIRWGSVRGNEYLRVFACAPYMESLTQENQNKGS